MAEPLAMSPYGRHIFLCTGRFCAPEGQANALYQRLPALLGELSAYDNPCRVKRGIVPRAGISFELASIRIRAASRIRRNLGKFPTCRRPPSESWPLWN